MPKYLTLMDSETLKDLYTSYTGHHPEKIEELPSSGSNRRYFRLHGSLTLIGVCGTSPEENHTFLYLAAHFRQKGISVPQVFIHSQDEMYYLQEDFGDTLLFDVIKQGRLSGNFNEEEKRLLREAIRTLPFIQFEGAKEMDFTHCHPQEAFNRRSILWDLNYFKYCFLKTTGIEFQEAKLEDDFQTMADILLRSDSDCFMYRDFQSRNIMVKERKLHFIDFQGGRKGPCYYDVVSFLWQAKANYPDSLRKELLNEYIQALQPYKRIDKETFLAELRHFILFRTLQVLGAYGFRGNFEKKPHFIQSIPFALNNLRTILKEGYPEYSYLCRLLEEITQTKQSTKETTSPSLTVTVTSFSYKKGIPADTSGNGGGFVFDCRAIHNPGKYDCYKSLTGLDEPVIRFLEKDGEITTFLHHVYSIVDSAVERYLERGFTNLSVCFGCTGGQHRSVYAAQHLATYLNAKFGVNIRLIHREQQIEQTFTSTLAFSSSIPTS